eukprot:4580873-Lingulodinium_polyedra.AAC.1
MPPCHLGGEGVDVKARGVYPSATNNSPEGRRVGPFSRVRPIGGASSSWLAGLSARDGGSGG